MGVLGWELHTALPAGWMEVLDWKLDTAFPAGWMGVLGWELDTALPAGWMGVLGQELEIVYCQLKVFVPPSYCHFFFLGKMLVENFWKKQKAIILKIDF